MSQQLADYQLLLECKGWLRLEEALAERCTMLKTKVPQTILTDQDVREYNSFSKEIQVLSFVAALPRFVVEQQKDAIELFYQQFDDELTKNAP